MGASDEAAAQVLKDLAEFVAIPSVSAVAAHGVDVRRAATWLQEHMRRVGVIGVRLEEVPGGAPVITGEIGPAAAPTVLVYGHYDVQPADPREWQSAPFTAVIRDDRLYGRGANDDKGPILVGLEGIRQFLASEAAGGLRIRFLLEGEEEIGSPHLRAFLAEHADRLRADIVVSLDGSMWRADLPSLDIGSRGMCGLEVEVKTADHDLHSGQYGGAVPNAAAVLADILHSLHRPSGEIAVEGFYGAVRPVSAEERADLRELPFTDAEFIGHVGAPGLQGEAGYATLERLWFRPTLEIVGMYGGYIGEGIKTIVPSLASAKISCRLVPDQDPQDILSRVTAHLKAVAPDYAAIRVTAERGTSRAYELPRDHPAVRAAVPALEATMGRRPAFVKSGGTLPAASLFLEELGAYTMFLSFGVEDQGSHSPNECFRISRAAPGVATWKRFLENLGPALRAARKSGS